MKTNIQYISRLIAFAAIILLLNSCVPESVERRSNRHDVITEILGPSHPEGLNKDGFYNWIYETRQDTIKNIQLDSIAVILAMELGNKERACKKLNSQLEELFPEGTTNTTVGKLTSKQLNIYKQMVNMLGDILLLRAKLKERISSFKPMIIPVAIVNQTNLNIRHYFFFNDKDELTTHLTDENKYYTEGVFKEFLEHSEIDQFYLSSLSNAINDIDTLQSVDFLYKNSTPLHFYRYVYYPEPEIQINRTSVEEHSPFPSGANLYVVTKQTYGTSTREGYDRLVEYANANDLSSIDYMVVKGEISILNQDDEVMMLDCGFMVSKVKNAFGYIVFVDTGSIRKKE